MPTDAELKAIDNATKRVQRALKEDGQEIHRSSVNGCTSDCPTCSKPKERPFSRRFGFKRRSELLSQSLCPSCKSSSVYFDSLQVDGDMVRQEGHCYTCPAVWQTVYECVSVSMANGRNGEWK